MSALCPQDVTDDRLADVLRLLSDDGNFHAFEQELMGQLVRVYDLPATCVRIDTTTASSYADVDEHGLLQLGHSKDHRPDLPQLKLVLASLDPLGMPLATEVLSGEHADDPVYLPIIARVRDGRSNEGCSTWEIAKWWPCRRVRVLPCRSARKWKSGVRKELR